MTILVDFSERMRGESRQGFIKRKLEQAHEEAVKTGGTVFVKGFFYNSDLNNISKFNKDLTPDSCKPHLGGGNIVTFSVTSATII